MSRTAVCVAVAWLLVTPATAAAQSPASGIAGPASGASAELPLGFEGPTAPVLPDTISRDASGRAVVRAIALTSPFRLDGQLDEAVYRELRPASDFIQEDPKVGEPATERTEVWVFFDDENVYVGARMWESEPDRMIVNEMRKDSPMVFQNESLTIAFDTFYDRRNGVAFVINPLGGRQDGQITNERWNRDWNTIFDFGVGRFDGGWTAELAIPFKSLRYRPGPNQLWGFNARRVNKWKNETSNLVPLPKAAGGRASIARRSRPLSWGSRCRRDPGTLKSSRMRFPT
jgi:hypothetical protein